MRVVFIVRTRSVYSTRTHCDQLSGGTVAVHHPLGLLPHSLRSLRIEGDRWE